ncbi:Transcription factor dpl-1 [Mitosporidium daphniae]|uniref:Uncharacterized protein n=1 Tax=Mitosporidium daphniae TaxID=1485682 RepID=A0A098VPF8_9MICR|nr:uncharacterized protein DI09_4p150 [Mitosporidium daphniae]KGG50932.1 hypothetical protein DI09_4p150 [Mitosporidium daphniae]|eukprot:XP_013237359.1 uncharacterized protein DI09_4p150 [Mitosporidium daphniae]
MFVQSSGLHSSTLTPASSPSDHRKVTARSTPHPLRGSSNQCLTKGLRHFSLCVCKKVEEKGVTTYNEVADELVADLGGELLGDQKNIRRRVYDALNVLMAMNIIYKNRKEITWVGLPNTLLHDYESLLLERSSIEERILQKRKHVQDLISRNLILRNKSAEDTSGSPCSSDILHLPFILINAPKDTRINCEMTHYYFDFDAPFSIHEDLELLKLMGLCGDQTPILDPVSSLPSPLLGLWDDVTLASTAKSSRLQFLSASEKS